MRIDVLTIFPRLLDSFLGETIIKRAQLKKEVTIRVHDIRAFTTDKHRKVDDAPYGGGPGMIFKPEPVVAAIEKVVRASRVPKRSRRVILLTPQGRTLTQAHARQLSGLQQIVLVCGRYEGFDARIEQYVDEQLSIGDYVLSGGEVPAMVVIDTVARLIPGVLGNADSIKDESFSAENDAVEYPQYTRPEAFRGKRVPSLLLSGDHGIIAAWRKRKTRTTKRR